MLQKVGLDTPIGATLLPRGGAAFRTWAPAARDVYGVTDAHASGHGTGWMPDPVYERIDWATGDFFYMPPNINHRHVNKSQDKPGKLLQVEAWP